MIVLLAQNNKKDIARIQWLIHQLARDLRQIAVIYLLSWRLCRQVALSVTSPMR